MIFLQIILVIILLAFMFIIGVISYYIIWLPLMELMMIMLDPNQEKDNHER